MQRRVEIETPEISELNEKIGGNLKPVLPNLAFDSVLLFP